MLLVCTVYTMALSRISPRVRARVSVSIVYRIATGGYSWIWPTLFSEKPKIICSRTRRDVDCRDSNFQHVNVIFRSSHRLFSVWRESSVYAYAIVHHYREGMENYYNRRLFKFHPLGKHPCTSDLDSTGGLPPRRSSFCPITEFLKMPWTSVKCYF